MRSGDRTGPAATGLRIRHVDGPAAVGVNVADDRPVEESGWPEIEGSGFSLLPGESTTVRAAWPGAPERDRRLAVDAWNLRRLVVR